MVLIIVLLVDGFTKAILSQPNLIAKFPAEKIGTFVTFDSHGDDT